MQPRENLPSLISLTTEVLPGYFARKLACFYKAPLLSIQDLLSSDPIVSMSHHYSRSDKGKWTAGSNNHKRRSPFRIPASDNSALIEANRLTLIGRATNPGVQKARAIIDFLPQFWDLEGKVAGRDLGRETFLFHFETEKDLQRVLRKGPYHYKDWMLIFATLGTHCVTVFPLKYHLLG